MSKTGRYYVVDAKTNRKFCVEPIGDPHETWGDVDPVTKKMTGNYGEKYPGSINEKDSIITDENGFKNITFLEPGISPESYIEKLLNK